MHQIPDDLFSLKPAPEKWSVAEICKHITEFNSLYISQMENALKAKAPKQTEGEKFKAGLFYRLFIRFLEPPYKIKISTIAPMYPSSKEIQKSEILNSLLETQNRLLQIVEEAEERLIDLNKAKGKNPVVNWIPMSISDLLLVLDAHQRRHVWQSEQTLKKLSGNSYKPG